MTAEFELWRNARDELQAMLDDIGQRWDAIPGNASGPVGLTPDSVKARPDWQQCRLQWDRTFAALRRHNAQGLRLFKREMAADARAKRERRAAAS